MRPDHRICIKHIIGIMPDPFTFYLDRFKSWYPVR